MGVPGILIGLGLGAVLLFAIASLVFGRAGATFITAAVGYCFGGPPGAGVGLVASLVMIPIVGLLGLLLTPTPKE